MSQTLHFLELSPTARPLLTCCSKWSFSGSLPGVLGRSLGRVSRVPPGTCPDDVQEHSESTLLGFRARTRTETRHELELKLERISRPQTRQFGLKLELEFTATRTRQRELELELKPELYFGLQRALGLDLELQA